MSILGLSRSKPKFRLISNKQDDTLPSVYLGLLILAFITTALPHFIRMPYVLSALVIGVLGFKLWRLYTGKPINLVHILISAVLYTGMVFYTYGRISGHEAGSVFLMGLLAIKLLESHSHRDLMICVFLAYFLAAINFLFSQTIPTALWMLVQVGLITFCLITINQAPSHSPFSSAANAQIDVDRIKHNFSQAGKVVLLALPIAIVLFVLFPRVPGPLWSIPKHSNKAKTGFSDTMRPGQVSELAKSGGVAFRVKFKEKSPIQPDLYWRGLTLWRYDGITWSENPNYQIENQFKAKLKRQPLTQASQRIDYTVIMEPHNTRSLFALDMPTAFNQNDEQYKLTLDDLYQLYTDRDVTQVLQYSVTSALNYVQGEYISNLQKMEALSFPKDQNLKTQSLAKAWARRASSAEQVVRQALEYFNQQTFSYSLTPPRLVTQNRIDEFLFESKEGFCEHYASAFVILMRSAGIPSRVVVGYQGGKINPITNDLTVRQSDAHAWAEVWLGSKGWVRVDPTAAVAPERVQQSLVQAINEEEQAQVPVFSRPETSLLKPVIDMWDAIDSSWNKMVLGYGPKKQKNLLKKIGLQNIAQAVIAMIILVGVGLFIAVLLVTRKTKNTALTPIDHTFNRLCKGIERLSGQPRPIHLPATVYIESVQVYLGDMSDELMNIAQEYNYLRFSNEGHHSASHTARIKKWQTAVKSAIKQLGTKPTA